MGKGWREDAGGSGGVVACWLAAFGGLLRDPIGSTEYWELNRAVMRFFENGDFVKIVLSLKREYNFQGSDPPKIGPESDSERRRREKSTKIASGSLPRRLFAPGLDFGRFWAPGRLPK